MNHPRPTHGLFAPGASSLVARAPSHGDSRPAVDERLVAPESHTQIMGGDLKLMPGANEGHASEHAEVALLLRGCLAPGYSVAIDMLTRATRKTDVAPDVSIYPSERSPHTGGRKLEELAFEVLDTESVEHVTRKALKLAKRGVRRLFYVRVSDRSVHEWLSDDETWKALAADAVIEDRCLIVPVPVMALANEILANNTVAEALLRSRNTVIEAALAARERDGRLAGERDGRLAGERDGRLAGERDGRLAEKRAMIQRLCAGRGGLNHANMARVVTCEDMTTLDRWIDSLLAGAEIDDALTSE
jgi:hypothetical protein